MSDQRGIVDLLVDVADEGCYFCCACCGDLLFWSSNGFVQSVQKSADSAEVQVLMGVVVVFLEQFISMRSISFWRPCKALAIQSFRSLHWLRPLSLNNSVFTSVRANLVHALQTRAHLNLCWMLRQSQTWKAMSSGRLASMSWLPLWLYRTLELSSERLKSIMPESDLSDHE